VKNECADGKGGGIAFVKSIKFLLINQETISEWIVRKPWGGKGDKGREEKRSLLDSSWATKKREGGRKNKAITKRIRSRGQIETNQI